MIDEDEIYRRVKRFLELPREVRPVKSYTITRMAGLDERALKLMMAGHRMRPDRLRRLSRVLELLEDGRIPDVDKLPHGAKRYRHLKLKRDPEPPCQPLMVLDLTSGKPRMVAAFVNPNTLPELAITRVRK